MEKPNKIELALLEEESRALRKEFDEFEAESLSDDEKIRLQNLDKRLHNIEIKIVNYKKYTL